MQWLSDPTHFFLALGVCLIAFEIGVMQLATFWFLYIGVGAVITALALWLMPSLGWGGAIGVFVVGTIAITLLLNRPLKKWQSTPGAIAGNDAIGQTVEVLHEITLEKPGKVSWSGTDWHAELSPNAASSVKQGDRAKIIDMHGITLVVESF